jgi:hypothetical protein
VRIDNGKIADKSFVILVFSINRMGMRAAFGISVGIDALRQILHLEAVNRGGIRLGFVAGMFLAIAHGEASTPVTQHAYIGNYGNNTYTGGTNYTIPQQKIFIVFSHFRVDTSGNVFATFKLNGGEIGGSEIELLNAAPGTSPATDKNMFTIPAKELISAGFADAINKLFNATVLTPGEELATLNLVARVAK